MSILDKDLASTLVEQKPRRKLTDEQQALVDFDVKPGSLVKLVAYAGTGKTSTFVGLAEKFNEPIMYLAFNKSVETEAKERFPSHVTSKTVHALAYGQVGRRYRNIAGSIPNWQIAKTLRLGVYESSLLARSLENYLNSGDDSPTTEHAEPDILERMGPDYKEKMATAVAQVWEAVKSETNGFQMTHSGYLKLYQLSRPRLSQGIVLLDEAQDTNPVTLRLVLDQVANGCRVYLAGDPYQQIYAWRGALDAMSKIDCPELRLTQSFRFGPNVADVANHILKKMLGERVPLRGNDLIHDRLGAVDRRHTTITRTNAKLFEYALTYANLGARVHVVGEKQFELLMDSLLQMYFLYSNRKDFITERRLSFFQNWTALTTYAEESLDAELQMKARIVEKYKNNLPEAIRKIRQSSAPFGEAEVILVTAHKAKGLEWEHVELADDFNELFYDHTDEQGNTRRRLRLAVDHADAKDESQINKDEVNLLYVAATRAKRLLQTNNQLNEIIRFKHENK